MPARWLLLLGLALGTARAAHGAEAEVPSLELLEFLGGFETSEGNWVDPTEIDLSADDTVDTTVAEGGGQKDE